MMHKKLDNTYQIQVWSDDLGYWVKVPSLFDVIEKAENIARFMGESNTLYHKHIRIVNLATYDIMFDKIVSCRAAVGDEPHKIFPIPNSDEEVKAVFEWHNVQ